MATAQALTQPTTSRHPRLAALNSRRLAVSIAAGGVVIYLALTFGTSIRSNAHSSQHQWQAVNQAMRVGTDPNTKHMT